MNKNVKIALVVTGVLLAAGAGVYIYIKAKGKTKSASAEKKFNRNLTFEKV